MPRLLRLLALLLACLSLVAAGCGDDGEEAAPSAGGTPEDTGGEQGTGCRAVDAPKPRSVKLPKPKEKLRAGRTYVATVTTSCGAFQITLDAKRAPLTGGSFKYLADKGFYDGTTFHRIVPDFVIQGGDPKGNGTGGPGYSIVEPPPSGIRYTKGVVAMAKTAVERPGTSGSQFFVVTGGQAVQLEPDYALLGRVTAGMNVVDLIGVVPANEAGQPVQPIVIEKIAVAAR